MSISSASLQCIKCGNTFISPTDEQEYFQSKGYFFEPKRCPSCRQARIPVVDNRYYDTKKKIWKPSSCWVKILGENNKINPLTFFILTIFLIIKMLQSIFRLIFWWINW
jgi:hypothetical protein